MTRPRMKWALLAVVVLSAGSAAAVLAYLHLRPALPEAPVIDLSSADVEAAEVITEAREAVLKAPRSLEAWSKLGMVLHTNFFKDEAIPCYIAARTLDPTNSKWHYLLGEIYMTLGKPSAAVPSWIEAARLAPPESTVEHLTLGEYYLDAGKLDLAEKEYQTVLASHRHDIPAQFGMGQVMMARNDNREALRYLDGVTEDPSCRKKACALRAQVHERLGNREAAERERRWLNDLPNDIPWPNPIIDQVKQYRVGLAARMERVAALVQQAKGAEAIELLTDTTKKFPQSDQAWSSLGKTYGIINRFSEAEHAFLRSINLAPQKAEHYYTLGLLYEIHGYYKQGATQFGKAAELSTNDASASAKQGDCLAAVGDGEGARAAYREALSRKPGMKEATDGLKKLEGKQKNP